MLIWLMNLGFAAGDAGTPPDPVAYSGSYKTVAAVSAVGKVRWVDYLPVKYVTPTGRTGTWDDAGALAVVTIAESGRPWVNYIPIVEVADSDAGSNRYDYLGFLRVVEVE